MEYIILHTRLQKDHHCETVVMCCFLYEEQRTIWVNTDGRGCDILLEDLFQHDLPENGVDLRLASYKLVDLESLAGSRWLPIIEDALRYLRMHAKTPIIVPAWREIMNGFQCHDCGRFVSAGNFDLAVLVRLMRDYERNWTQKYCPHCLSQIAELDKELMLKDVKQGNTFIVLYKEDGTKKWMECKALKEAMLYLDDALILRNEAVGISSIRPDSIRDLLDPAERKS